MNCIFFQYAILLYLDTVIFAHFLQVLNSAFWTFAKSVFLFCFTFLFYIWYNIYIGGKTQWTYKQY